MNNKEINEYIARYMGYVQNPDHPIYPNTTYWFKDNEVLTILLYDTSWDWLVPVIQKVHNSIGIRSIDECNEEEWRMYTWFTSAKWNYSIEQMYSMVTYFLQWQEASRKRNILKQCVGLPQKSNGKTTSKETI